MHNFVKQSSNHFPKKGKKLTLSENTPTSTECSSAVCPFNFSQTLQEILMKHGKRNITIMCRCAYYKGNVVPNFKGVMSLGHCLHNSSKTLGG
jgi:hypothetical protein